MGSFGVDGVVVSGIPPKWPPLVVIVALAAIDSRCIDGQREVCGQEGIEDVKLLFPVP